MCSWWWVSLSKSFRLWQAFETLNLLSKQLSTSANVLIRIHNYNRWEGNRETNILIACASRPKKNASFIAPRGELGAQLAFATRKIQELGFGGLCFYNITSSLRGNFWYELEDRILCWKCRYGSSFCYRQGATRIGEKQSFS